MSISVDLQYVTKAKAVHLDGFSVVYVSDGNGNTVKMYFKEVGHDIKADIVADAINTDWTKE